jgi:K+-sensing histidine kinase KdpD
VALTSEMSSSSLCYKRRLGGAFKMLIDTKSVHRCLRTAAKISISCAFVSAITFVLWAIKVRTTQPTNLIFFYLLPITPITYIFGTVTGLISGVAAASLGFYFLYEPMYSFGFVDVREIGDVGWFLLLVLLGTKCIAEIRRPSRT